MQSRIRVNTTENKQHLDFFSVVSAVFCTVVGVGIFYKNKSVFSATNNNWQTILFIWLLISFICGCTAFVYSKISALNTKSTGLGYCGWSKHLVNDQFSNFVSKLFIFFKLGIAVPGYCFYAAATFLRILTFTGVSENLLKDGLGKYSTFGICIPFGLLILVSVIAFNWFAPKKAIELQKFFLYFKFLPIIFIVVCGIMGSIISRDAGYFSSTTVTASSSSGTSPGTFSISNGLLAGPGIMLSFDGFLNAGFYSKKIKEPKKLLPKIYMSLIAIFTVTYLIITINQILNKTGVVHEIIQTNTTMGKVVQGIFLFFIFLSALGLINGYSTTAQPAISSSIDDRVFFINDYFYTKNPANKKKIILGFWVGVTAFWTTVMIVFAAATNSDAVFDGLTNVPTMFLFCVYGILPIAFCYRMYEKFRYEGCATSQKELIQSIIPSIICCVGWTAIVLYTFIYICGYLPITNANTEFTKWNGPWGISGAAKIKNWMAAVLMAFAVLVLFGIHFIDEYLKNQAQLKGVSSSEAALEMSKKEVATPPTQTNSKFSQLIGQRFWRKKSQETSNHLNI